MGNQCGSVYYISAYQSHFCMSGKPTARSYGHSTESKTLYSTNHSPQNHRSTDQNAWIRHDEGAIRSRYGTNGTVVTSHSYENDYNNTASVVATQRISAGRKITNKATWQAVQDNLPIPVQSSSDKIAPSLSMVDPAIIYENIHFKTDFPHKDTVLM